MAAHLPISQVVQVERPGARGRVVIVCEHASNRFPLPYGTLGLTSAERCAHIAWDPGALGVARGLARRLDTVLVRACTSRLIYDLNRPPHAAGAMAETSEIYPIPGNRGITPDDRVGRTRAVYLPFHRRLQAEIATRLARGALDALITVHSFTPVYRGQRREVEFGVIHDADDGLARAIADRDCGLVTRLNEPYSASDGVAHTLAMHATPFGLPHAMLEIRNDLIADDQAQQAMADRLAPVIRSAIEEVAGCRAG